MRACTALLCSEFPCALPFERDQSHGPKKTLSLAASGRSAGTPSTFLHQSYPFNCSFLLLADDSRKSERDLSAARGTRNQDSAQKAERLVPGIYPLQGGPKGLNSTPRRNSVRVPVYLSCANPLFFDVFRF